jgi:hypothetical protein
MIHPLVILFILLGLAFVALIVFFVSVVMETKKQCTDGPAFWCASPLNWKMCVDDSKKHTYKKHCCDGGVKKWMDMMDTKDSDPNTNGYNKHCK